MYYNKSKITEDEAKDFDTILSKAKVTFPLQNSWYINGFYDGLSLFGEKGNDADAGMVFPKDGADITSYLVDVVANPNFSNDDGASGLAAIKDGSADVLFSGTWSAADVKEALGDNYAATQLPTFTVNGETREVLVGDGIAEVTPTFVLLLVDSAERPEDIDRNRAEAARIRAEERLQHKQSMHEYYQSKIALDRAMQRLQTAAKYKR